MDVIINYHLSSFQAQAAHEQPMLVEQMALELLNVPKPRLSSLVGATSSSITGLLLFFGLVVVVVVVVVVAYTA